jgi:hypothetical protein
MIPPTAIIPMAITSKNLMHGDGDEDVCVFSVCPQLDEIRLAVSTLAWKYLAKVAAVALFPTFPGMVSKILVASSTEMPGFELWIWREMKS